MLANTGVTCTSPAGTAKLVKIAFDSLQPRKKLMYVA